MFSFAHLDAADHLDGTKPVAGGDRKVPSDLASAANVSVPTLRRMEASAGPAAGLLNNVLAVRRALEAAGIIFVESNGEGPGVRVRKTS